MQSMNDIKKSIPERSFRKAFEEKMSQLNGVGIPKEQTDRITQGNKAELLRFSDELQGLKNSLPDLHDEFVSVDTERRIKLLVDIERDLIDKTGLIKVQSGNAINAAMEDFEEYLAKKQYLSPVKLFTKDGGEIGTGRTFISLKIEEVISLQDHFKLRSKEFDNYVNSLIENKEKFEQATALADNWLDKHIQTEGVVLSDVNKIFAEKAEAHQGWNRWGWFFSGLFAGVVAVALLIMFILCDSGSVSAGVAITRTSTVFIITAFSAFCFKHFVDHEKYDEIYQFKQLALQQMGRLIRSYTDPSERQVIFSKAMDIVFKEPNLKDEGRLNKELVDHVIEILKSKM